MKKTRYESPTNKRRLPLSELGKKAQNLIEELTVEKQKVMLLS